MRFLETNQYSQKGYKMPKIADFGYALFVCLASLTIYTIINKALNGAFTLNDRDVSMAVGLAIGSILGRMSTRS